MSLSKSPSIFSLRTQDAIAALKQQYPAVQKGAIILFGAFEQSHVPFRQESSFYYLTGITEPAAMAILDFDGTSTLYLPDHGDERARWVHSPLAFTPEHAKKVGFNRIAPLGQHVPGYQLYPFSPEKYFEHVCKEIHTRLLQGATFFTLMPNNAHEYLQQRIMIDRFDTWIPGFKKACLDISPLIARMRRKKDISEIEALYKAVEITMLAQEAAAQAIAPGISECEVQASLEYMFTGSCARPAFGSIVATGKNATILHYTQNNEQLKDGQLVVVDSGADFAAYCADITRTYPVSGTFNKRQKELYNLVLATQEYVAEQAKPGMWLFNKEVPEKSLHHLAKKFLDERGGYGKYFIHSIGHFLGMDVHDVGDVSKPLADGDVFTIEPGIYIPQENIGIRIEDNYWLAKESVICLSESLAKKPADIEALMQQKDDESTQIDFNEEIDEADGENDFAHD